jgi:hypothetical protein
MSGLLVLLYFALVVQAVPTATANQVPFATDLGPGWKPTTVATPKLCVTALAERTPHPSLQRQRRQADIQSSSRSSLTSPLPTSPAATSSFKPGQVVASSTRLSVLPAAICGFAPWYNGTATALGTCNLYKETGTTF